MRCVCAAKHILEWLFWAGLVAATRRRGSFERVYDLPERVLPPAILSLPTPNEVDARRAIGQGAGHRYRARPIGFPPRTWHCPCSS